MWKTRAPFTSLSSMGPNPFGRLPRLLAVLQERASGRGSGLTVGCAPQGLASAPCRSGPPAQSPRAAEWEAALLAHGGRSAPASLRAGDDDKAQMEGVI